MVRRTSPAAALLVACLLGACSSVELAAPIIRTRTGPAAQAPVRRVVALPATCGALTQQYVGTNSFGTSVFEQRSRCSANAMKAVDQVIRSNLELGGYSIIDAERVNAITASRHEVRERSIARAAASARPSAATGSDLTSIDVETIGARFEDATPLEQQGLLAELGAQGVLTTRVTVGAEVGIGMRRTVIVQLQLLDVPERVLVWAQRCELEVGGIFSTDEVAMDRAARCASDGVRSR